MKKSYLFVVALLAFTLVNVCTLVAQDKAASIEVVEAKLGTAVENRVITGEADSFPKGSVVFVWFKVSGANGQELTVNWKGGTETRSTTLNIGGSPWRSWASKTVRGAGDWTVSIATADGTLLKELKFKVE